MPVIATNTSANTALVYLNKNSRDMEKSLGKLSAGTRIVKASDDAAGLAVASRLQADITVLQQAGRNALQARSVLQVADGGLARIGDILQRMKSLAAQSASGSVDSAARGFIDTEYQQLLLEIDDIATTTEFNGQTLLNANYNESFLVGVDATGGNVIAVDLTAVDATSLSSAGGDVTSYTAATTAIADIDADIDTISTWRADLGGFISRFEFRGDVIDTAVENLSAARSSIYDVDIASEQTNLTSKQVMTEAAIAALAQANQMKSSLLALVR
ncbi:MAG: flagellin [Alphaproteobacteria bacterium]|nr:flagellin [Alphaproteobacteria bacterium]